MCFNYRNVFCFFYSDEKGWSQIDHTMQNCLKIFHASTGKPNLILFKALSKLIVVIIMISWVHSNYYVDHARKITEMILYKLKLQTIIKFMMVVFCYHPHILKILYSCNYVPSCAELNFAFHAFFVWRTTKNIQKIEN